MLGGSKKGAVGAQQSHSLGWYPGYMLTLQALSYIEGNNQTGSPIWNCATGTLRGILRD